MRTVYSRCNRTFYLENYLYIYIYSALKIDLVLHSARVEVIYIYIYIYISFVLEKEKKLNSKPEECRFEESPAHLSTILLL